MQIGTVPIRDCQQGLDEAMFHVEHRPHRSGAALKMFHVEHSSSARRHCHLPHRAPIIEP